ncbi:unnamed protein product [Mytilus edulis]|uniref:Uncharacterized protein n=1 Tax=Mytilus edulis TaxID=6550 RepID=A0A8S3RKA5_MYTED|nr:unnamed protein product [Mytilus edulis]
MNTAVQGIRTDVHGMNTSFQAIGWNIHGMDESVQRLNITLKDIEGTVHGGNTTLQALERSIQGGNTTLQEINTALQGIPLMNDTLQKLLYYVERVPCTCQRQNPDIQRQERQSYHLGQDIFHLQHQFDKSSPSYDMNFPVNKAVITNDGYVASIDTEESLMNIYKTDGSYVTAIRADGLDFTAVNNSMVAVTRFFCNRIDIWDIHNEQKVKVKSIQLLPKVLRHHNYEQQVSSRL